MIKLKTYLNKEHYVKDKACCTFIGETAEKYLLNDLWAITFCNGGEIVRKSLTKKTTTDGDMARLKLTFNTGVINEFSDIPISGGYLNLTRGV